MVFSTPYVRLSSLNCDIEVPFKTKYAPRETCRMFPVGRCCCTFSVSLRHHDITLLIFSHSREHGRSCKGRCRRPPPSSPQYSANGPGSTTGAVPSIDPVGGSRKRHGNYELQDGTDMKGGGGGSDGEGRPSCSLYREGDSPAATKPSAMLHSGNIGWGRGRIQKKVPHFAISRILMPTRNRSFVRYTISGINQRSQRLPCRIFFQHCLIFTSLEEGIGAEEL